MKFILEVMKIKSLIFLLAFFHYHFSYAQNRYEEDWVVLDHDTMFLKKDMHKISGIVYNKHGDIGTFFQGLREGLHKEWFRNGNIKDEITFKNGIPLQDNFNKYRLIRHSESPKNIKVYFVKFSDNAIVLTLFSSLFLMLFFNLFQPGLFFLLSTLKS